ncbi:helix-turn-helix transcriptional regulator [Streptomyces sp. NPDC057413]|uniref:helix-turn-helix transcriptional regulator n=1 Tax=Streptomyces sp. NPDC057413 TaxID=3346124 RepID=UPI00368840A3
MTSPPSERSPHLTVAQLAERWQTTPAAIYIARHRGKAPKGFKRGTKVLFPLTEVERFEAEQMAGDRPSHRGTTYEHRPAEALRARRSRKAVVI